MGASSSSQEKTKTEQTIAELSSKYGVNIRFYFSPKRGDLATIYLLYFLTLVKEIC